MGFTTHVEFVNQKSPNLSSTGFKTCMSSLVQNEGCHIH